MFDTAPRHASTVCEICFLMREWKIEKQTELCDALVHCPALWWTSPRIYRLAFNLLHAVTVKGGEQCWRQWLLLQIRSHSTCVFWMKEQLAKQRLQTRTRVAAHSTGEKSFLLQICEVCTEPRAHRLMTKFTSFGPKNNTSRLSDAKTITHLSEASYYKLYWHRWVFVIVGFW